MHSAVLAKAPRKKRGAWTRKKLHRQREAQRREARLLAKAEKKQEVRTARRDTRLESVFQGCDPERTERRANGK